MTEQEAIAHAEREYGSYEIEIQSEPWEPNGTPVPNVSPTEDGTGAWVMAWVWVETPED